ncbi:hypothetical protein [Burkholderia paludis]|uniref:hypothetical protein n=1 Tax=Burkholderia paludis TaxID=1506587 RepID=UPI00126A3CF3|nr:hypothetical protein [Burkholderia paludis]
MRKLSLLLVLALSCFNATAQQPSVPLLFSAYVRGLDRAGFAPTGDDPPLVSPDQSPNDAREYCMQEAASQLIQFDDGVAIKMASILPKSPTALPWLQRATLYPSPVALVRYNLRRNACVRGMERYYTAPAELPTLKEVHFREVAVSMPLFEHLYSALTTCEQMYGREQINRHAQCIKTIAEHLDR